jgi:hypothetical protein
MDSRYKKPAILIWQTICSLILCIPAIIYALSIEMDIDGTNFGILFAAPIVAIAGGYCLLSNLISWGVYLKGKYTDAAKVFLIISIILSVLIYSPFLINKINVNLQASNFEYADNTPCETPLINTVSYNYDTGVEENIYEISKLLFVNNKNFESNVTYSEYYHDESAGPDEIDTRLNGDEGYCEYITIYNDVRGSDCLRSVGCYYYGDTNLQRENHGVEKEEEGWFTTLNPSKKYLDFVYMHTIDGVNLKNVNSVFIANDIQNIFGEIKNREEFENKVNEYAQSCRIKNEQPTISFKTATGAIITVETVNYTNSDKFCLRIYCTYLMEV